MSKRVAIVGGGFTGTLAVALLAEQVSSAVEVIHFNVEHPLSGGIAYGTTNLSHLLNVEARRMSAYADDSEHFLRWLREKKGGLGEWRGDEFVPRQYYREYLNELRQTALEKAGARVSYRLIDERVCRVQWLSNKFHCTTVNGTEHIVDAVFVAVGSEPSAIEFPSQAGEALSIAPFLRTKGVTADAPDSSIVILGTGLTMVDSVLSLLDQGHRGSIVAISRHGYLPRQHALSLDALAALQQSVDVPQDMSLQQLLRWFQIERKKFQAIGADWRALINALRAPTVSIWQHFSEKEARRFTRHVRPLWDVHRHRIAPVVAARLEAALESGQLRIERGRISSLDHQNGKYLLRYRNAKGGQQELLADQLLNCTGLELNLTRVHSGLMQDLYSAGILIPGRIGIGVELHPDCDVQMKKKLYLAGNLERGRYWEMIAVPELRVDTARKVAELLENLVTVH